MARNVRGIMTRCEVDECERATQYGRLMCASHWMRQWRHGDPLAGGPPRDDSITERFMRYVAVSDDGCWLWSGQLTNGARGGYGRFVFKHRRTVAHRVSYELFVGAVPEGLELDHLCRVRRCVNPAHLEPVTRAENSRRAWVARHVRDTCEQSAKSA